MSRTVKRRALAAALAACALALAAGCAGGARRSLTPTMALRNKLAQEYDHQNVFVNLRNGNTLAVAFVDSRFNGSDATARARAAQEIAEYTRTHFVGIGGVERIVVQFDASKSGLGLFQTRENLDFYVFDPRRIAEGDLRAVYEREAAAGEESEPGAASARP